MIAELVSITLILMGLLFFLGAVVGLLRFPDFYSRMHAAGKGDTLSTLLILLGFLAHYLQDFSLPRLLVGAKILAICGFIAITSPTSTHALMRAGYDDGIKPWKKGGSSKDSQEP